MKIAIVTGCAGFLGKYLTLDLLNDGWEVFGIDKFAYMADITFIKEIEKQYYPKFQVMNKDICDIEHLPLCDVLINTAAESHVSNSIVSSDSFFKTNVLGVKHLLELISPNDDKPLFFHISTDEVYGETPRGKESFIEKDPLRPGNPYSASKAAAEMVLHAWQKTYGTDFIIVRPANYYGASQYPEKLIPLALQWFARGKTVPLHEMGTPKRCWLNVEDACSAIKFLIEHGKRNEIYNIAGPDELTNLHLISKIVGVYFGDEEDTNEHVDFGYSRPGQDVRYAICDQKLKKLGWKPEMILDEEIKYIVEEFKRELS